MKTEFNYCPQCGTRLNANVCTKCGWHTEFLKKEMKA